MRKRRFVKFPNRERRVCLKFLKRPRPDAAKAVQLRSVATHPFGILSGYVPLGGGETAVYREVREAVPVIDAAVVKLIRLTGGFSVECPDKLAEAELREFLRTEFRGGVHRGARLGHDGIFDLPGIVF